MSKKPTPLQAFKTLKQDIGKCYEEESIIVEEALKENKKLKKLYKSELRNTTYYNNLALKYKKVVEIINEHRLDIDWFLEFVKQDINYKYYVYLVEQSDNEFAKRFLLNEEEYNLLKEIFR